MVLGSADAGPLTEYLARWGLSPKVSDGKGEVWIILGDMKWKGIRFQELSTSIALEDSASIAGHQPAFLIHAYNSNRFFAWSERVFFKTPFIAASISLSTQWPLQATVRVGETEVFGLNASDSREPVANGRERDMECIAYLPSGSKARPHVFYSALFGSGQIWNWDPSRDELRLGGGSSAPAFELLRASNFVPSQLSARQSCTHQKSKTYSIK